VTQTGGAGAKLVARQSGLPKQSRRDSRATGGHARGHEQAGPEEAELIAWAFSLQVLPVRLLFGFFQESLD
jgi:hypothetical protein